MTKCSAGSIAALSILGATLLYGQVFPVRDGRIDSLAASAEQHHAVGMALLRSNDRTKAIEELNKATVLFREYQDGFADSLDADRLLYRKLLLLEPESPVYNYLMGRAIQYKDPDSAAYEASERYFTRAGEIESAYPWAYFGKARKFVSRKQYGEAIRLYSKAIAADSSFDDAYQALLSVYRAAGRDPDAARLQLTIERRFPGSFLAVYPLVEKARSQEDPAEKIRLLRQVVALSNGEGWDSFKSELLFALSELHPDSAVAMARRSLAVKTVYDRKIRQTALILLFEHAKRKREELRAVTDQIYGTPDPWVLSLAARYYGDSLRDDREALRLRERAYSICTPETVLFTLISGSGISQRILDDLAKAERASEANEIGWLYYKAKDYERAARYLAEAVQARGIPAAFYRLGETYLAMASAVPEESRQLAPYYRQKAVESLIEGLVREYNGEAMDDLGKLMGSAEKASKKVLEIRHLTASTAPDFTLQSLEGDSIRLSSLRGKVVVIDFWATWCGPCVAELPYLQKLHDHYRGNPDVQFLCISTDNNRDPVRPFIEKNKYTMKVLYSGGLQPGARGSVESAYGVTSIPLTLFLDRDGKISLKHSGFGGDGEAWLGKMEHDIDELLEYHPERE